MPKYHLSAHLRACIADGTTILLDIKSERYIGLSPAEAGALQQYVEDWPAAEIAAGTVDMPDAEKFVCECLAQGLLTLEPAQRIDRDMTLQRPMHWLGEGGAHPIRSSHVVRFCAAVVKAWIMIRMHSLQRIVSAVASRKAQMAQHAPVEMPQLIGLACIFTSLRPFFYTGQSACLFDSLVLIEFLAAHGIYPTWVIGVCAMPFSAHSWVQHEDVVLNDIPEEVLNYTPILII